MTAEQCQTYIEELLGGPGLPDHEIPDLNIKIHRPRSDEWLKKTYWMIGIPTNIDGQVDCDLNGGDIIYPWTWTVDGKDYNIPNVPCLGLEADQCCDKVLKTIKDKGIPLQNDDGDCLSCWVHQELLEPVIPDGGGDLVYLEHSAVDGTCIESELSLEQVNAADELIKSSLDAVSNDIDDAISAQSVSCAVLQALLHDLLLYARAFPRAMSVIPNLLCGICENSNSTYRLTPEIIKTLKWIKKEINKDINSAENMIVIYTDHHGKVLEPPKIGGSREGLDWDRDDPDCLNPDADKCHPDPFHGICPLYVDPVLCGKDGDCEFSNSCFAGLAGWDPDKDCKPQGDKCKPNPKQDGRCTMGSSPVKCGPDKDCEFGNLCFANLAGFEDADCEPAGQLVDSCHPSPVEGVCTLQYEPVVCGDNCSFSNTCFAALAGFDPDTECTSSTTIEKDICKPNPTTGPCTKEYQPVTCGDDNICEFANLCLAKLAGFVNAGDCTEKLDACRPNQVEPIDMACADVYKPVICGDGCEFSNSCYAMLAGWDESQCKIKPLDNCYPDPKEGICTLQYDPVICGQGCEFGNSCQAELAGWPIDQCVNTIPPFDACQPDPKEGFCSKIFLPVTCGTDKNCEFTNICYAQLAGFDDSDCQDVIAVDKCLPNPTTKEDIACIQLYEPVICAGECEFSNSCYAQSAGFSDSECEPKDTCFPNKKEGICPAIYDPVICDALCEFSNSCLAELAGWDPSSCVNSLNAECYPDPKDGPCTLEYAPVLCGETKTCEFGNRCMARLAGFDPEVDCDVLVIPNECPPENGVCPEYYDPLVCGYYQCKYSNSCFAEAAGFNVKSDCSKPSETDVCQPDPQDGICTEEYAPVLCGEDCKFGNACFAKLAGFDPTTECKRLPVDVCQPDLQDGICTKEYSPVLCGEDCKFGNACFAKLAGFDPTTECNRLPVDVCQPKPQGEVACPAVYAPVICGQDCEFGNSCEALAAGFEDADCEPKVETCYLDKQEGICPAIYAPVICGNTGTCQFDNSCTAKLAGWDVESSCYDLDQGPPVDICNPDKVDGICDTSIDPVICGLKENCVFENICLANLAGWDDTDCRQNVPPTDECKPNPTDGPCTKELWPVLCGISKTCEFSNRCLAKLAGFVDEADCTDKNDKCRPNPMTGKIGCLEVYEPVICGYSNVKSCEFSNMCHATLAGWTDSDCDAKDECYPDKTDGICTLEYSPWICGNNCTFGNSCFAEMAGWSVDTDCKKDALEFET